MAKAYINIGSNIGDRLSYIDRAVAAIEAAFGTHARRSHPYRSDPWGYVSPNEYINLGITIDTSTLTPPAVLQTLLDIQQRIFPGVTHRTPEGLYTDREIDIDLIALDSTVYEDEKLCLPHRRMAERLFVLEPMRELWPGWIHPISHLTPAQMIAALK